MALKLNRVDILATFDKLVEAGEILYGPSNITRLVDEGFPFEFRSTPALQAKPSRPEDDVEEEPISNSDKHASYDAEATLGPGSDIKRGPPEFLIAEVNESHILIFNKFCVYRAQYMLLTADSYQRQESSLAIEDLAAAWNVLDAFNNDGHEHYLFYNCTSNSGNSREHKHMQLFEKPLSGYEKSNGDEIVFALFPDSTDKNLKVPFKYFIERLDTTNATEPDDLLAAYERLLVPTREALGLETDTERCPHNLILVRQWMMLIPRRKATYEGNTVSSAGMLGLVWADCEEHVDEWKKIGPVKILTEVGVPV
ncbi:hypothetical protein EJ08DRAFT_394863 [Tothia fuscella]|uniref:Phosphorylase n=1 Tax=Tothia fuscella TaxID=1048955 RepID=A0A9P4P0Y8_9PEZI|nr:hypothetical protein EJ08DRAFT_394863 [Tothia fuscella]